MFRHEKLIIGVLVATGAIGAVIYNWPFTLTERPADVAADDAELSPEGTDLDRGSSPTNERVSRAEESRQSNEPKRELIDLLADANKDASNVQDGWMDSSDALQTGDRLLTGGNSLGAYQQYSKVAAASHIRDGALLVRLGLAAELGSLLDRSAKHYLDLAQSNLATPAQKVHGLMGTARVWEQQERWSDATRLLSELCLLYGGNKFPNEIRVPIHQKLADCVQKQVLAGRDPHSSKVRFEYAWTPPAIEALLFGNTEMPSKQSRNNKIRVVERPDDDVQLILVQSEGTSVACLQLIRQLEDELDLVFRVSDSARSKLAGRSVAFNAHGLPVAVLLDLALSPLNVGWSQEGSMVHVINEQEMSSMQRESYAYGRIERLRRQVQLDLTDDNSRTAALMNDANNLSIQSKLQAAEDVYHTARELNPASELSALLFFNRANNAMRGGDANRALNLFYHSLDQSLSPQIQSLAYGAISDLELQLGRPDKSVIAASRGLRITSDPEQAQSNLLTLAKAYLLQPDALSANRVLRENHEVFQEANQQRLISVLATYARFQITRPARGLQNEGERLVLALASVQPSDLQNFVDHLLISRAYAAVGFNSKATQHLSIAAESAKGDFWANRIRIELAQMQIEIKDFENAQETIRNVSLQTPTDLQKRTYLLRATIAQNLGFPHRCIQDCEALLALPVDSSMKRKALEMMGSAYRKTDQHYAAALCFAGLLPSSQLGSTQVKESKR